MGLTRFNVLNALARVKGEALVTCETWVPFWQHPLVREGIARQIELKSDMTLVAEASNGREAIQQFREHRPDVTLMDLQMPEMGGLDALMAIRNEFPEARILVLTTYKGDVQIMRALKSGARGVTC